MKYGLVQGLRAGALTALTCGLSACIPMEFSDLHSEATTLSLEAPQDYSKLGFGSVIVGYAAEGVGGFGSRIAVSAGADSPFIVYPMLTGDRLGLEIPVMDGCDASFPCPAGAAGAIAAVDAWGERRRCVAVVGSDGTVQLRCDDDVSRFETVSGPAGEALGAAAIGLGMHAFGRALLGAPDARGGRGTLYRLPDGAAPQEVDLSAGLGDSGQLGSHLAAAPLSAAELLVVASAPLGPMHRVIVSSAELAVDGSPMVQIRTCLDAATAGYGDALVAGDLNGDGLPELVIGSGAGMGRAASVEIYDGATLPTSLTPAGDCSQPWAPTVLLSCNDSEGVECEDSLFGSSLAMGDVNGDGLMDLLVGAPNARVDGTRNAGAVQVFAGSASLAELPLTRTTLRTSTPVPDAKLGASLSAVAGGLLESGARRFEVVAGAPGVDRVYVFLCSGLTGDTLTDLAGARCQPSHVVQMP